VPALVPLVAAVPETEGRAESLEKGRTLGVSERPVWVRPMFEELPLRWLEEPLPIVEVVEGRTVVPR
jgi:hypothetical protein